MSIKIAALNDLSNLPILSPLDTYTRNKKAFGGALNTDVFIARTVTTENFRLGHGNAPYDATMAPIAIFYVEKLIKLINCRLNSSKF